MYIEIPGNPIPKKTSQRIVGKGKFKRILQSERFLKYDKHAKDHIKRSYPQLLKKTDAAIEVRIHYYRETKHRVDMTNLQEGTDDILTEVGVIKDDNSKIIKSHDGSRVYFDKENPRTEIWILPFKERFEKLDKEWKKTWKDY